MARYGFLDEADEIFPDTVTLFRNESTFDPKGVSIIGQIKNEFLQKQLKEKFGEIIDDQEQYEHNEKQRILFNRLCLEVQKIKLNNG